MILRILEVEECRVNPELMVDVGEKRFESVQEFETRRNICECERI
jgi:hypothetical protein